MGLRDRLKKALEIDNSIFASEEDLAKTQGVTAEHMQYCGLSKSDLKKLERLGFARRGYTKNEWKAGEKMPNGQEVREGMVARGRGHRVRWILVAKKEI